VRVLVVGLFWSGPADCGLWGVCVSQFVNEGHTDQCEEGFCGCRLACEVCYTGLVDPKTFVCPQIRVDLGRGIPACEFGGSSGLVVSIGVFEKRENGCMPFF
jgi:hypothetical protein